MNGFDVRMESKVLNLLGILGMLTNFSLV